MTTNCGDRQLRLLGLLVSMLVLLLGGGCGGGGASHEDSAADTTTTAGGAEQTPEAALDAALEKSFQESVRAWGSSRGADAPVHVDTRALGVADLTSKEPMTSDLHHRIGSVTKTFTISLFLQAEAEGLLSLDDTIDQYVDDVPNGDKITLRQMANMTSGIASYTGIVTQE